MLPEAHTGRARRREWLALRPEKAECFYEVDNFSESPGKSQPKKRRGRPPLFDHFGGCKSFDGQREQDEKIKVSARPEWVGWSSDEDDRVFSMDILTQ